MTSAELPEVSTEAHPIRGVFWGLLLGIGLAGLLISMKVVGLALTPFVVVVMVGVLAGTAWGRFGPARPPRVIPTAASATAPAARTIDAD